jgi:hypothetical protein
MGISHPCHKEKKGNVMNRLIALVMCALLLASCAKSSLPNEGSLESSTLINGFIADLASNTSGVYAVGSSTNSNTNIITTKRNSSGVSVWSQTVNKNVASQQDIAVDAVGNSYSLRFYRKTDVNGRITETGLNILKYTNSGLLAWTLDFAKSKTVLDPQTGIFIGEISEYPYDIKTDTSGNVYVLSVYRDTSGFLTEKYFVRKFDPTGKLLKTFAVNKSACLGASEDCTFPVSLQLDKADNVYILSVFDSDHYKANDLSVIKFDATGKFLWQRTVYSILFNGILRVQNGDFTLDSQGNIFIAVTQSTCDSTEPSLRICGESKLFIRKLQNSTGHLWTISVDNKSGGVPLITTDAEDNIYIASPIYNLATNTSKLLVAKYNSNGVKQWLKEIILQTTFVSLRGLSVSDGVYVAGQDAVNPSSFITKLDKTTGQTKW